MRIITVRCSSPVYLPVLSSLWKSFKFSINNNHPFGFVQCCAQERSLSQTVFIYMKLTGSRLMPCPKQFYRPIADKRLVGLCIAHIFNQQRKLLPVPTKIGTKYIYSFPERTERPMIVIQLMCYDNELSLAWLWVFMFNFQLSVCAITFSPTVSIFLNLII